MTADKTVLAVTRRGRGEQLVLVHGYFGGAGHWLEQIDHFSDRYDVIAVNLAGFGDSAHLTAPESIEGHADLVWRTLDHLGLDRIFLLGHSMGGMIVQQMAATQSDRVKRLIVYGTGPVGNLPGRFEPLETSRQRLLEEGTEPTMRRIAATWLVEGEQSAGYAPCLAEGIKATDQAALSSLTAWENWNGTAALPEINMPVLIIWGEQDRSYPRSQVDALMEGFPNARLAVMPSCSHAAHLENTPVFHEHLDGFLSE